MILHNQADADVIDYPIEEPGTKQVHLWSIKSGQTLDFPEHVGKYLLQVYGFLQEVITLEEKKQREDDLRKVNENRHFVQFKIVNKEKPAPQASGAVVEPREAAEGVSSDTVRGKPNPYPVQQAPETPENTTPQNT